MNVRGRRRRAPSAAHTLAVCAASVLCLSAAPTSGEIFEGSGFEALDWKMRLADASRVMGGQLTTARNTHSGKEYLRAAPYEYLGCTYVLLLNFDDPGGGLSEIVLTRRADAKAAAMERSCRAGLSRLRQKLGRPL